MAFSDAVVEQAWIRAGGNCECLRTTHGHIGRCNKLLLKTFRGDRDRMYGWEAHSRSGLHLGSVSDCEILCYDPCHKSTF